MDDFFNKLSSVIESVSIYQKEKIFVISTTSKSYKTQLPYLTPFRDFPDFIVCGAVIFTQSQARRLALIIEPHFDKIIVDVEKKVSFFGDCIPGSNLSSSEDPLFRTLDYVELGNISAELSALKSTLSPSVHFFKANDVTIDSIWLMLESILGTFDGKKITIVGAGNIGSKLALKLVESGANVTINRRDHYKGYAIAEVLNLIKPTSTFASVCYELDMNKACYLADVVIGATNGIPAITGSHLKGCSRSVLCIDAGKGSFSSDAIQFLASHRVPFYRTDITSGLFGCLSSILYNSHAMHSSCGFEEFEGVRVVSGGIYGYKNDIVVDNYKNITQIFGVCDGTGDFKSELSSEDQRRIEKLTLRYLS